MATFQKIYCADNRCSEGEFLNHVLWRCLHRRAYFIGPLLSLVWPDYFAPDRELLRAIAQMSRMAQVEAEIGEYVADHRNSSWLRGRGRMRLSTRQLRSLVRTCIAPGRVKRAVGAPA